MWKLVLKKISWRERERDVSSADVEPPTDEMEVDSTKESSDDDLGEEEDGFIKKIQSTLDYIIRNDRKELIELLTELKEEATENYIDILLELGKHIDAFLTDEHLEGKPIFSMVGELRRRLQSSPIIKSKHYRNVGREYQRESLSCSIYIYAIGSFTLKQLVKEELVSPEKNRKLSELEDVNLPAIAVVIKKTKIGKGLKFLP